MTDKEKEIQQKYLEFQMFQQQLEQITQYLRELDMKLGEYVLTKKGLSDLEKVKVGSEIFAPIAPGIFVKAELKDTNELLVNIGANISAIKDRSQAIKLIDRQIEAVQQTQAQLNDKVVQINEQAQKLAKEFKE